MGYNDEDEMDFDSRILSNRGVGQEDLLDSLQKAKEKLFFLINVYEKVFSDIKEPLRELMYRQYPVFNQEKRTKVLEFIDQIVPMTCDFVLFRMKKLVDEHKAGVDYRAEYPEFESWVEFYGRSPKPLTIDESTRDVYTWLNDKQWSEYVAEENAGLLEYFNWSEKRKFDYVDLVQTALLKHYKELGDLNGDGLIMFAVAIVDEYEVYKSDCEYLEEFIDCGFPEEYLDLPYEEYQEYCSKKLRENMQETTDLRNRRIAGEMI